MCDVHVMGADRAYAGRRLAGAAGKAHGQQCRGAECRQARCAQRAACGRSSHQRPSRGVPIGRARTRGRCGARRVRRSPPPWPPVQGVRRPALPRLGGTHGFETARARKKRFSESPGTQCAPLPTLGTDSPRTGFLPLACCAPVAAAAITTTTTTTTCHLSTPLPLTPFPPSSVAMRLPSSAPLAPGLPPLPRLQRQRRQTRADGSDSTSDSDSTPDSGSGSDSDSNSAPASTPTPAPPAAAAPQTLVLSHLSGAGSLSYTLEVTVDSQTLPVQLDTGSSDLWLASTRCSTSVCRSSANGEVSLFNPRGVTNAGANANLTFPQGAAAGPIVTSPSLYLGPGQALRIDGQAFVSAANVENFELGPGNFTGTLGLGPPAGSVVQAELYIQSGNTNPGNSESDYSSTGSVLPALLHGIPLGTRYFSLGLRRLPSEGGRGDSTLVLGGIDTNFVPSASAVYSEPVAQGPGVALGSDSNDAGEMVTSFRREPRWRTYLQSMSVDVGGENTSLPMQSKIGGDYPIALFSSATSYSLAPSSFLNAFYGAYGFQPSSDGGYYVPCTTMLNVTLQLGQSNIPVPIHPLDLSLKQQNDGSSDSSYCLGGFQAIEGPKGNLDGTAMEGADVVIGTAMYVVPWMPLYCYNGSTNS